MSKYHQEVLSFPRTPDLDFWRRPQGVVVPDDELNFLLVPDAVEAAVVFELSLQVNNYQRDQLGTSCGLPISRALIVTMGGMLPGVLLYDHLVDGRGEDLPEIAFGTVGVSLYEEIGQHSGNPLLRNGISIPVDGHKVLLIDDLGDSGLTLEYLRRYVADCGACEAMTLALYMKPQAMETSPVDFWFGETAQDTWIITPRERVETIVRRVPLWKHRGADEQECRRRLVELIGVPATLVDYYLPRAFAVADRS